MRCKSADQTIANAIIEMPHTMRNSSKHNLWREISIEMSIFFVPIYILCFFTRFMNNVPAIEREACLRFTVHTNCVHLFLTCPARKIATAAPKRTTFNTYL